MVLSPPVTLANKAGPFRGRCAYCESYIADFQHGDIEHFRPKKGVTDENDFPVRISKSDGSEGDHPGYFWLAYSWKNLLPSCITCNQPGEEGIGKRNRFPLELPPGHAMTQKEIANERPLLLNPIDPEDDDPEDHLDIELETGVMTFKNNSKRGEICIKMFGLNTRDQLVRERRTAINEVKALCAQLLWANDSEAKRVGQELKEIGHGSLSYTLARRAQIRQARDRIGF